MEARLLVLKITKKLLIATLSDGRVVSVPIARFPVLASAKVEKLEKFGISPGGYGVHWLDLDEDLSIKTLAAKPIKPSPKRVQILTKLRVSLNL